MTLRAIIFLEWTLDLSLLALPIALTFSRAIIEILLVVIILTWLSIFLLREQTFCIKNSLLYPTIAFLVAGIISTLSSNYLMKSLEELLNLVEYGFLGIISFCVFRTEKKQHLLIHCILISALVVGLDGIFQLTTGFDLFRGYPASEFESTIRISASFSHPNSLGAYLAMIIPINIAFLYQKPRSLFWINLPILIFVMAMTYSRGAWAGLVIALFVFSFLKDRKISFVLLCLLISATAGAYFVNSFLFQRIRDVFDISNVTTQMRFETWKSAWNLFCDKPLFGYGLKNFSLLFKKGYVHNCYLQILVEMGISGLLAFLWLLFAFFKTAFKYRKSNLGLGMGSAILAFSIHSMSDTNLYSLPIATLFWLLLGAGTAILLKEAPCHSSKDSKP